LIEFRELRSGGHAEYAGLRSQPAGERYGSLGCGRRGERHLRPLIMLRPGSLPGMKYQSAAGNLRCAPGASFPGSPPSSRPSIFPSRGRRRKEGNIKERPLDMGGLRYLKV